MMDIGIAGALVGGVLTLLSPCSVMLLPAFFSYAFSSKGKLISRTGVFYLGLVATLVPMGVLAGTFGGFIAENRILLINVAAGVVILFGLIQLLGVSLPVFNLVQVGGTTQSRNTAQGTSPIAIFVLGTVYGLAGACTGPILGSVLTLAAMGGNALYGGIVLAVFALGMALPLLFLAVIWSRFTGAQRWLRPRVLRIGRWTNTWTQIIGGLLSVGIGIFLIVSGGMSEGGILGATEQFRIETQAMQVTGAIPDYLVLAGAAIILVLVLTLHWWLKKTAPANSRINQVIKPADSSDNPSSSPKSPKTH